MNEDFPRTKYLPVNLMRILTGFVVVGLSVHLELMVLIGFSSLYFLFSLLWLLLTLFKRIDEDGHLAYIPSILDLSIIAFFVYLTDGVSSPLTIGLLLATGFSSVNLKLNQGLLSLIYGNMLYLMIALADYYKWLPNINTFGHIILDITLTKMILSVFVFWGSNLGIYVFVKKLSLANSLSIQQKDLEREKAEEALRQAEASNIAKRFFLANMSHEIRTPMNGIIGLASLLKNTELTDEQLDFLDSIVVSADNLISIINDILDFSKIEANKLEIVTEDFNLEKLVLDLHSIFQTRIRDKKIKWTVDFDIDLPKWIHSDPVRLRQILINLLGNAIKFTPPEGQIKILIKKESNVAKDYMVKFQVSDTGIGIADEKLRLLFQPFEQLDRNTNRKFGGTGLGLAISNKLVSMLGGILEVKSDLGSGSIFHFSIPVQAADEIALETILESRRKEKANKIQVRQGLRILSVDDNEINQKLMHRISKTLNIPMDFANDGRMAVLQHFYKPYDLIFMDMQMPIMDGLEATRRIRKIEMRSFEHSLIIAMTANAFEEDRQLCRDAGMDDFLAKPIKMTDIIEIIAKYDER
ncbi:MAG: ATP-binding protein [Leptospira sp.]|nr:ATP-binding protein [Leptospira sp.]